MSDLFRYYGSVRDAVLLLVFLAIAVPTVVLMGEALINIGYCSVTGHVLFGKYGCGI